MSEDRATPFQVTWTDFGKQVLIPYMAQDLVYNAVKQGFMIFTEIVLKKNMNSQFTFRSSNIALFQLYFTKTPF